MLCNVGSVQAVKRVHEVYCVEELLAGLKIAASELWKISKISKHTCTRAPTKLQDLGKVQSVI